MWQTEYQMTEFYSQIKIQLVVRWKERETSFAFIKSFIRFDVMTVNASKMKQFFDLNGHFMSFMHQKRNKLQIVVVVDEEADFY